MYIVYNIIKRYHIMISHGRMEGETLNIVLIANIVALVGSLLMVGVGLLKKKNQILLIQCVQFSIQGAANLLLGGITGAIANAVSIARNLFCLKFEYTACWKVIFLAVQVMLSLGTNNLGMLGWLPVISAMIYTWFLDVKDEVQLNQPHRSFRSGRNRQNYWLEQQGHRYPYPCHRLDRRRLFPIRLRQRI